MTKSPKKRGKKTSLVGEETRQNSGEVSSLKGKYNKELIAHNFSLKFPLHPNCKIPFSNSFHKKIKLRNNSQFLFYFNKGFIRQTSKNLIVFPFMEKDTALPLKSFELKARLSTKAQQIVKAMMSKYVGLRVLPCNWKPSTQEYAVEDAFAQSIDFTYKNELAIIDKSVHQCKDGFINSGGEIDWKTPEFADSYIRMPITFMKAMKLFEKQMNRHSVNIEKHLHVLDEMEKTLKALRPRAPRLPSKRNSATLRGVV